MSQRPEILQTDIAKELLFVDREEELRLLKGLLGQTLAGRGQIVFVGGEGGIGKTRLVQELGSYARVEGAIFATASSYEDEGLVPYSPWIEAIRSIVHQSSKEIFAKTVGRTIAEVGRLVPELAVRARELGIKGWLSGPETGGPLVASDTERIRLFQAIVDFLILASREKPLVLFLDDILWADAASLQLVHFLCRRIRDQRIMVVASYRDVELPEDHPLSRLLLDLNRERILRRVILGRLTTDHIAAVISNQLGGGLVAPEFVKLVHSRTGGNPFFVEEVLRALTEDREIHRAPIGWTIREMGQVGIPSTVKALIKRRVARLGNEVAQTLANASAIGMDFPYELLSRVSGQDEDRLISQVEKATGAGLIRERHIGKQVSYIFADEQIRDFLYGELSLIRKRKVHAKIAEAIETLHSDEKDRHLEELAHHYIQAGETAKAAEFSLMAGDRAAKLHAHPDAKKHYKNFLDLLEEDRRQERLEPLIHLGDTCYLLGEYEESVRYYREAIEAARQLKQNRKIAQIYLKLAGVHWGWTFGGGKQEALELYKEALSFLAEEKDSPEEAAICQDLARLLINTGELDAGFEWCEKSIRIAREVNAHETLAHALQTLALGTRSSRENWPRIFHYLNDSLRISMEYGLEGVVCRAYANLGTAYFFKFEYAKARETYLAGVEYAKKIGFLASEVFIESWLALQGYVPLGEWNKALEVAVHSFRVSSEFGDRYIAPSLIPLGIVHLLIGNLDRAEEYLLKAYPLASEYREIFYPCCWGLGRLHAKRNLPSKAEYYLLEGEQAGLQFGLSNPPVQVHLELVDLYAATGDLEKLSVFYEKIQRAKEASDEKGIAGIERWAYGILAFARKEWNQARDAFITSSEIWSELKNPYYYALTAEDLGRVSSMVGSREEGTKWTAEAKRIFAKLGAKLDLERIEHASM